MCESRFVWVGVEVADPVVDPGLTTFEAVFAAGAATAVSSPVCPTASPLTGAAVSTATSEEKMGAADEPAACEGIIGPTAGATCACCCVAGILLRVPEGAAIVQGAARVLGVKERGSDFAKFKLCCLIY